MRLPGADTAIVEREKIVDYLLNAEHPDNGGKAKFFQDLGFNCDDWESLAVALRNAADKENAIKTMASTHGLKYIVDSSLESPSGKTRSVRMVWIIDRGLNKPRLVTAFPHGK